MTADTVRSKVDTTKLVSTTSYFVDAPIGEQGFEWQPADHLLANG